MLRRDPVHFEQHGVRCRAFVCFLGALVVREGGVPGCNRDIMLLRKQVRDSATRVLVLPSALRDPGVARGTVSVRGGSSLQSRDDPLDSGGLFVRGRRGGENVGLREYSRGEFFVGGRMLLPAAGAVSGLCARSREQQRVDGPAVGGMVL